jgi:hypothetical protein
MKLYILNKQEFEEYFSNNYELIKKIHITAFNELKNSIDGNFSIPLVLTPDYNNSSTCLFDFVNKKEDIYFYKFITTII